MKRLVSILALALLLFPATALAKKKGPVYVPPDQSAASQYTEDVPTAGGATPTSDVHHATALGGSSAGSSGGSSGGSGGSSSAAGGSSISSSTLSAMSESGTTGAAAASVAAALAPAKTTKKTHVSSSNAAESFDGATTKTHNSPETQSRSRSAAGQVIKTLAGSDAGSGVGVLLPIILVASLVLATVFGAARFFRPGAAS